MGRLVLLITTAAAAARVDPAVRAVMAVTAMATLAAVKAAAAARVDRRLLLAQREQAPLVVMAAQGGLQALGVLELHQVQLLPQVQTAAVVVVGMVLLYPTAVVLWVLQFR